MVTLKNCTCAFLENDRHFLLMKRSAERDMNPNFWSGVGGKIESNEINDPFLACMREINEETGMVCENIENLTLRYIIMRRHRDVIRQSYIYFGKTNTRKFVDTDEGSLHWIPKEELGDKNYTSTYQNMIQHYLASKSNHSTIFVGTAENSGGKSRMCWAKIEDFVE